MSIQRKCCNCGELFDAPKWSRSDFCSEQCSNDFQDYMGEEFIIELARLLQDAEPEIRDQLYNEYKEVYDPKILDEINRLSEVPWQL